MRIAPYIIFGSGSVLYLWRGAGKMATINSTETGRAAAAKNYTARNSFYNILINVRDNSMLSCPRIKRHTGARQFEAHRALELTLRSIIGSSRPRACFFSRAEDWFLDSTVPRNDFRIRILISLQFRGVFWARSLILKL